MGDLVKKYGIFINTVILIIVAMMGWSFKRAISQMDKKADKELVDEKIKTINVSIESNAKQIENNKEDIQDTEAKFLTEIQLLRQALQLKQNKEDK